MSPIPIRWIIPKLSGLRPSKNDLTVCVGQTFGNGLAGSSGSFSHENVGEIWAGAEVLGSLACFQDDSLMWLFQFLTTRTSLGAV